MVNSSKLTNLQLDLLKIFSIGISDSQIIEIRDLLSNYFAENATKEMDALWEKNNWSQETMDEWANTHLRINNAITS
ncbi:MAG: hypothetical protein KIT33_15040 [Candidatus Kapabacteria bacterium]|nr:hypothetical protein [Ignavibacteriota bacterium]MCW5886285.1 hypothetical protein [Candidatus Kapabacteria bacterium]